MTDQYARASLTTAVAQLIEAAGFDSSQKSSLEILTDLLHQYIAHVGNTAHSYAEVAGRSAPNALDVTTSLQDLGVTVPRLMRYANTQDELPFAQTIAEFPVHKVPSKRPASFVDRAELAPGHIPPFLPALPDDHAFKNTPQYPTSTQAARALPVQQKEGEAALEKLEARMQPHSALLVTTLEKEKEEEEQGQPQQPAAAPSYRNPFLEPPQWEARPAAHLASAAAAAPGQGPQPTQPATAGAPPPPKLSDWAEADEAAGGKPGALPAALTSGDRRFRWAWVAASMQGARDTGYEEDEGGMIGGDKAARRQKRVADGTKRRVDDILALHGEEFEAGEEDGGGVMAIAREQI